MTTAHFLMVIRIAIRFVFAGAPMLSLGACLAASPTALFVDRDSGGPVPGVVVTLSAGTGSWEFETDAGCRATLNNVNPGIYRLRIEKPGYLDPAAQVCGVRHYYLEEEAVDAVPQIRQSLRYLAGLR